MDFPACGIIHTLLLHLKLGRHYKGQFLLTQKGKKLVNASAEIFETITPAYLFEMDHAYGYRPNDPPLGNWSIYLNVLNIELQTEKSGLELRTVFLGQRDESASICDNGFSALYHHVIKPLCWAGLVQEFSFEKHEYIQMDKRLFLKTALWSLALELETDDFNTPVQFH